MSKKNYKKSQNSKRNKIQPQEAHKNKTNKKNRVIFVTQPITLNPLGRCQRTGGGQKQDSLTNPGVGDHPDEVLRRQRLKHRHKELHGVLVLGKLAANGQIQFTLHYNNKSIAQETKGEKRSANSPQDQGKDWVRNKQKTNTWELISAWNTPYKDNKDPSHLRLLIHGMRLNTRDTDSTKDASVKTWNELRTKTNNSKPPNTPPPPPPPPTVN